jgi:hypothetical protein
MLKPVMDCPDIASFKDDTFTFAAVKFLSSLLEQSSGRSFMERTLVIEVQETYFEIPKKSKVNVEPI